MKGKVTIFDVAEYAGVSKSTVSLVLNESSLVKQSTRSKVLNAIQVLNYVPDNNARGLSSKRTNCIGIIIVTENEKASSYDFSRHVGLCSYNISTGIMDTLINSKYGALMERFCSVANPGELPSLVRKNRVDGIIIVNSPYDMGMIAKLKAIKLPFVLAGVDSLVDDADCVISDSGEGVAMGLRHLVEKGNREIAFLNCPTVYKSAYIREKALYRVSSELGINIKPEWIRNCDENNGESAYITIKQLWDNGARPNAVLCANGQLAVGAMRYLSEIGVRVPDDVSFFGYEDNSISGYSTPPLSTVDIHKEKMGAEAAKRLIEKIENNDDSHQVLEIPQEIVFRESVKDRN